jgi:tRNA pseudouridine38-40 synthase
MPPFEFRRALHFPWALDEEAMMEAARKFEGRHDFTSFAASSGDEKEDSEREMVREMWESRMVRAGYAFGAVAGNGTGRQASAGELSPLIGEQVFEDAEPHYLDYYVRGNSFLRYMVRKIVGTLLEVGKHRMKVSEIDEIFEAKDRSRSGVTVEPDGLCLMSLEYPDPTDSLKDVRKKKFD